MTDVTRHIVGSMTSSGWDALPKRHEFDDECRRLLAFGERFPHPDGGSAWLDDDGAPDLSRPVFTWITARMAHVYALGEVLGHPGAGRLVDQALAGLTGPLRDQENGGWLTSVDKGESPDEKACYTQAFVVLAAASGTAVGRAGARTLLREALDTWDARFWDEQHGMFVDRWDRSFSTLDPYRGVNSNMHSVEALLAAADVLDDDALRQRALRITLRVIAAAEQHEWRIPEHYTPDWQPLLEHNRDNPADPFQPFGATVGHGLEWARLILHLEAALGATAPPALEPAARALFDRAVQDGWSVDGEEGFVYTTDWDGTPVVRDRLHWVAAEAICTASALLTRTSNTRYGDLVELWWQHVQRLFVDHERGSWHHQLTPDNVPTDTVWPGKPDLYHAVQAMLLPGLPLNPALLLAVRLTGGSSASSSTSG
jgi:mannose/cellobiose epimerase-like protein (N-acyl-D-glucosamine 2-epimerase family)